MYYVNPYHDFIIVQNSTLESKIGQKENVPKKSDQ